MNVRYLLLPLVALAGALTAASLTHSAHAAGAPAFTAVDFHWQSSQGGSQLTIPVGSTVAFAYPTGSSMHNVDFGSGPQPISCTLNGVAATPPVPSSPAGPGWSAGCTFDTPGTYTFHCDMHPSMVGTILVTQTTTTTTTSTTAPATTTSTSSPTTTSTSTPYTVPTPIGSGNPSAPTATFLSGLRHIRTIASTVPPNGDVNPYGVVVVPTSNGKLSAGHLLVSNFNDRPNTQGTGRTIVEISTSGERSVFARIPRASLPGHCPGGIGLTTALAILPGDYVIVGSLPTTNGKSATAKYGCLIVLNSRGRPLSTIAGTKIQGPWDMTAVTSRFNTSLFVSNALNGGAARGVHVIKNSTVLRINLASGPGHAPKVLSQRVIANGIPWRDDPAALVIGPTGVALAADGTLYLANTIRNQITKIPDALTRTTAAARGGTPVSTGGHLKQPLGLTIAPNGDIITTNAGDGNMVETTSTGRQVAVVTADRKTGAGSLFGLTVAPDDPGMYYVDDGDNTRKLLD